MVEATLTHHVGSVRKEDAGDCGYYKGRYECTRRHYIATDGCSRLRRYSGGCLLVYLFTCLHNRRVGEFTLEHDLFYSTVF